MPPKLPPKNRKFDSGSQKRKKKRRLDELTKSQLGDLDKFIIRGSQIPIENQNVHDNIDVEILENVVTTENIEDNVVVDATENANLSVENVDVDATENDYLSVENVDDDNVDDNEVDSVNGIGENIYDPTIWDSLDSKMIDLLAIKGPKRDLSIVKGPKDKFSRRFTANLFTRVLSNGEKCDRDWLVYSKELDRVFCFCYKIFRRGMGRGQLANDGFGDWGHVGERLQEHETGTEHVKNMTTWYQWRSQKIILGWAT
jgi:hypothetical protein